MAATPRVLLPGSVVLVSTRMEEGLYFPCTKYMKAIIWSALATAYEAAPVTVCHFSIMPNHIHMIMKVTSPELVALFMDRFKTETAHAINNLLGRVKRTIWCRRYDSPRILTYTSTMAKIVYCYTNPAEAGLVNSIDEYNGISSWSTFHNNGQKRYNKTVKRIRRHMIPKLPKMSLSKEEDEAFTEMLFNQSTEEVTIEIAPDAWYDSFNIKDNNEIGKMNKIMVAKVRECEATFRKERDFPVIGPERLRAQPLDKEYLPTDYSPRMLCISDDNDLRMDYIAKVKDYVQKGRDVLERWRAGDYTPKYPIGLFPPPHPKNANLVPGFIEKYEFEQL